MQPTPFGQVPAAVGVSHAYHQHNHLEHRPRQPQNINTNTHTHTHRVNYNLPSGSQHPASPTRTRRRLVGAPYTHVHAANMNQQPRNGESWVEVSSQPSDSYSSSSTDDVIITDGLQLPANQAANRTVRRRRNTPRSQFRTGDESSENEEDYDDDEMEDMENESTGSSIAELHSPSESVTTSSVESDSGEDEDEEGDDEDEDDEDEEEEQIVPRAAHLAPPTGNSGSRPTRPFPASRRFSREPPQPDHDAALRASLSTLLSCAAAARGLPKSGQQQQPQQQQGGDFVTNGLSPAPVRRGTGLQMETFTLMPDSQRQAMLQNNAAQAAAPAENRTRRASDPKMQVSPGPSVPRSRKPSLSHQRQASAAQTTLTSSKSYKKGKKSQHHRSRAASQATPAFNLTPANISYITLAVSAGALILVSAISFSAGYMLGKEVGKEMALLDGSEIAKQAALGRTGGRIVRSGMGSSFRSITVA